MDELLDDIVYALFLTNFERSNNEKGLKDYLKFRKEAVFSEHCGDCTWESCPCVRCSYERMFDEAKIILRVLYNEGYTQGGREYDGHRLKRKEKCIIKLKK